MTYNNLNNFVEALIYYEDDLVKNLINSINLDSLVKHYDEFGMEKITLLMLVCISDSDEFFIQQILNDPLCNTHEYINKKNNQGKTALDIACKKLSYQNIEALLDTNKCYVIEHHLQIIADAMCESYGDYYFDKNVLYKLIDEIYKNHK